MPEELDIYAGLTPDQAKASQHVGTHARLLAGPGTGKTKTMTNRVLSLVLKHNVDPNSILILTFTRLAAAQLREEVGKILASLGKGLPHIATLHSFALKQILHNSGKLDALPSPVRIADDWEERHIIQEDLKRVVKAKEIGDIQTLIQQLSTDWETLRADEQSWEKQFPNAQFIGAWRQHRSIYGYTLRAELVYQLKRALNQSRDFTLDNEYKHVLIDEYQDLNACDLAIVHELSKRKSELFVAGDDDQSIYGFRYADPVGIRQFAEIFPGTEKLALEICFRCDKNILAAATFVADLDVKRLPKPTRVRDNAEDGSVRLLNFENQDQETAFIAAEISNLITKEGVNPGGITILLRGDKNGVMSKPLVQVLTNKGIKVSTPVESELGDSRGYRIALSYLRLLDDPSDGLAQRTLLQESRNGIGETALQAMLTIAFDKNQRFSETLAQILKDPSALEKFGKRIAEFWMDVSSKLDQIRQLDDLPTQLDATLESSVQNAPERAVIKGYLQKLISGHNAQNLHDLIRASSVLDLEIEQDTEAGTVNILTMHQAKGLTFDTCFIVGVEDEIMPGRNEGDKEGDERRLLYVSMTRAKHRLHMTYCAERTGAQSFIGRKSAGKYCRLTRFLRDSPLKVEKAG